MNDFVRYLKKRSSADDKLLFNEWMTNRKLSTEEAIERFKNNNNMPDIIINTSEFVIWLDTLGYRRTKYDK